MRVVYFCMGWVMVALGVIGAVTPLLPTTIFLIAAAGCFARSSPRLEAWLLDHPRFGKPLRDWRAAGAISRPAKLDGLRGHDDRVCRILRQRSIRQCCLPPPWRCFCWPVLLTSYRVRLPRLRHDRLPRCSTRL